MRKLLVLVAAVAALAFAGLAQAGTFTYFSPFATQAETVQDANGDGFPEAVTARGDLQTASGSFTGAWHARIELVSSTLATVHGVFRYPYGYVFVTGTLNPSAEDSGLVLTARSVGKAYWEGTLTITDLADTTEFVFRPA